MHGLLIGLPCICRTQQKKMCSTSREYGCGGFSLCCHAGLARRVSRQLFLCSPSLPSPPQSSAVCSQWGSSWMTWRPLLPLRGLLQRSRPYSAIELRCVQECVCVCVRAGECACVYERDCVFTDSVQLAASKQLDIDSSHLRWRMTNRFFVRLIW